MKQPKKYLQVTSKAELLTLQRTFAEIIRRPLALDDQMTPDERAEKMIQPSAVLSSHERLELYAQQYWWRIREALDEDFPMLRAVLGDPTYHAARDLFLTKFPSVRFSLRYLGERFPGFLRSQKRLLGKKWQLAVQCAEYEWAIIEAFDTKDGEPLNPSDIAAPSFLKRKLTLQPHARLLELNYPFHEAARRRAQTSTQASNTLQKQKTSRRSSTLTIKPKETLLVTYRLNNRVSTQVVKREEWQLLQKIARGSSLEQLLSRPSKKITTSAIQEMFFRWAHWQWIAIK